MTEIKAGHPPRVGVIGGGQLARMMITPATELGLQLKVLAEAENSPAALAASVVGDYTDLATVEAFAKTVDVITFDHEHVPIAVLQALETAGVSVQPPSKALIFAQNKLQMRRRLTELGLPMPVWAEIQTPEQLDEFLAQNGQIAILKTPIGGRNRAAQRRLLRSFGTGTWPRQKRSGGCRRHRPQGCRRPRRDRRSGRRDV